MGVWVRYVSSVHVLMIFCSRVRRYSAVVVCCARPTQCLICGVLNIWHRPQDHANRVADETLGSYAKKTRSASNRELRNRFYNFRSGGPDIPRGKNHLSVYRDTAQIECWGSNALSKVAKSRVDCTERFLPHAVYWDPHHYSGPRYVISGPPL